MARGQIKTVDVAALGNLCVDVVLTVPSLPPAALDERKAYMERLSASPPDKVSVVLLLLIAGKVKGGERFMGLI